MSRRTSTESSGGTKWSIPGAEGESILGNTHMPEGDPRGVLIIAHGFKGYKDYGMFPRLAQHVADRGFIAHRFNFSHSGMTNNTDTFERPDLFERDTWNKQVFDLEQVVHAAAGGDLAGRGLPHVLLGHSRGGVSVLLTAGRSAERDRPPPPAGLITIAAPDRCNTLSDDEQFELLERGYLVSPSNRTGQMLRLGRAFLQEQIDEPEAHDLLSLVARIRCPLLIVHGEDDPTVPASCATAIAGAATSEATVRIIPGGDHVMNTPNPMPPNARPSPQLTTLLQHVDQFLNAVSG